MNPHFIHTVTATFEDGAAWLQNLPALIAACEQRWSIRVLPPFPNLSYNYAAPAIRADGSGAVLKLGVPNPELMSEIEALRLYDGHGIARLLEHDAAEGALLLERLQPGTTLVGMDDDEQATVIAAGVMRQLWRPVPSDHPFPTLERWTQALRNIRNMFDGGTGPLPERLVAMAQQLLRELLAAPTGKVLLHGDLHHDNILQAERQPWLAIDPTGIVGEPEYEVGALLHNPLPKLLQMPQPGRVLARRIDILAEQLDFDRQRIAAWGVVNAVLSACWSAEDGSEEWIPAVLTCAELMAAELRN
jgi:streptomycin 6-kinase